MPPSLFHPTGRRGNKSVTRNGMLKQSAHSFSVQTILNVPKAKLSSVKGGAPSEINLLTRPYTTRDV
jgi:hypothetical protein